MQHKWAEVICAWASGKNVQFKKRSSSKEAHWEDFICGYIYYFDNADYEWRIKPVKRYRVAVLSDSEDEHPFITCREVAHNESDEQRIQNSKYFARWLTDWVTYE